MKNQITTIEIQNFKSIKKLKMDCKRINLFIGKPNVGKSNILEALSLYAAPQSQEHDKFLSDFIRYEKLSNLFFDNDRKNIISIVSNIGVAYFRYHMNQMNQYDIVLGADKDILKAATLNENINQLKDEFNNYVNNNSEKANSKPVKPFYENINEDGKVHPDIIKYNSPIKKYDFKKLNRHDNHFPLYLLPPEGKNLFTMIESHPEFYEEIIPFFNQYKLDLLVDTENNKLDVQKRINNKVYKIPYSLAADTLQRIIFHLAAVATNKDAVLLFEEPEVHSFPPYVRMIAERIIESKENQFFIATHSPYLLTPFIEQCSYKDAAIFICTYENHETKANELNEKEIKQLLNYGVDIFFNLESYTK